MSKYITDNNIKYFSETFGLVSDHDSVTENGQLFLTEYLILFTQRNGDKEHLSELNELMIKQLENSFTGIKGLYHRNPILVDRRIISHDNLIGIMAWSRYSNTFHNSHIWSYMVRHLFTYDNTQGRTKQLSKYLPHSPQSVFTFAVLSDSKLLYTLFPFLAPYYFINLVIGSNKPYNDVSGKILDWVTFQTTKDKWYMRLMNRYFEGKMKKMYGEDYIVSIMDVYHGSTNTKNFPINKLLGIGY